MIVVERRLSVVAGVDVDRGPEPRRNPHDPMTRVWLTADLHFGHRMVAGLRGFDAEKVSEHDQHILDMLECYVEKDDQLWVLGDIALNHKHGLNLMGRVPGRKHLVTGNHDRCHPMFRDAHKRQSEYLQVFESVQMAARRRIGGQEILLSHMPYSKDHTSEIRHQQWRLPDLGVPLLHGHTHSSIVVTSHYEIHVGWDAWNRPVGLDEIEEMLNPRPRHADTPGCLTRPR